MRPHMPTDLQIQQAVCKAFSIEIEALEPGRHYRGKSPIAEAKHVYFYLLCTRGLQRRNEVVARHGIDVSWGRVLFEQVRQRAMVNADFAARVWEAEKIILGINQ